MDMVPRSERGFWNGAQVLQVPTLSRPSPGERTTAALLCFVEYADAQILFLSSECSALVSPRGPCVAKST